MKKIFLFLFVILAITGCTQIKKQTAKGTLVALLTKYVEHKSISYRVNMRMKYFGRNDTVNREGNCKLIRDSKDTLFNGYVWLSAKWGHYLYCRYFDLDSIYLIDDSLKKITIYNQPKKQYWAITGNTSSEMMNTFFMDTSAIIKILKDSTISKTFSWRKINNEEYWEVSLKFPNDSELKDRRTYIWVNPHDSTLKRMVRQSKFQNEESYVEWDIDSIVFDKETPQSLKKIVGTKFATYSIERYSPPNEKPLNNGVNAPDFKGADFATQKKVSLSDYRGKVVLLDFWYMDCIWCVRAMPAVERIRNKFASKGLVVLGINSFDTSDEQQKKLPDFIKINKNTYSTILTNHNTDKAYKVYAYPTLYLIDRKGNIAYSDIGYRENLDSLLTVEINKLTEK